MQYPVDSVWFFTCYRSSTGWITPESETYEFQFDANLNRISLLIQRPQWSPYIVFRVGTVLWGPMGWVEAYWEANPAQFVENVKRLEGNTKTMREVISRMHLCERRCSSMTTLLLLPWLHQIFNRGGIINMIIKSMTIKWGTRQARDKIQIENSTVPLRLRQEVGFSLDDMLVLPCPVRSSRRNINNHLDKLSPCGLIRAWKTHRLYWDFQADKAADRSRSERRLYTTHILLNSQAPVQ